MRTQRDSEYDVVITRGRVGFPRGVWTTVNYRPMAESIVRRLRREDGVTAHVRKREQENPAASGGFSTETWVVIGLGAVLVGGLGYLIYNQVQQAQQTAAATNAQLAQANATGQQLVSTAQQAQGALAPSTSPYALPGTPAAVQAAGNAAAQALLGQ
jgi:hypothetical protein